jgi:hypothetical protein
MPLLGSIKGALSNGPQTLFTATVGDTSLFKTLFPGGSFLPTGTSLPQPYSATFVNLLKTSGTGSVSGAIWTPGADWSQALLDFAIDGAADLTATLEFGKFYASGALVYPLLQFTIKSATNPAGGFSVNPINGLAVSGSTTLRACDLFATTGLGNKSGAGQVFLNLANAEDDFPLQLRVDLTEAPYYYMMVTNISTITKVIAMITPLGD